jgi:hypothetical protein
LDGTALELYRKPLEIKERELSEAKTSGKILPFLVLDIKKP